MEQLRHRIDEIEDALRREAAVVLIGPRQVGKTTLAHQVGERRASIYLDLESPRDIAKLSDAESFFDLHQGKLVILDEIHRMPDLFAILRGVIDRGRRSGKGTGRFLLLGSASMDLMRQSESLAGRLEYVELRPFDVKEIDDPSQVNALWLRGGFPRAYLAGSEHDSLRWRQNYIRTYLERDIPHFQPRAEAALIGRLWTMLAHLQGQQLNASSLAKGLGVSATTVRNYVDLLEDLLLLRRLPPYLANVGKRLVKSPKVYIRDSGVLHGLLGISTLDELMGHPVIGASWEGMVVDALIGNAPYGTQASYYRTQAGAEVDLVLEMGKERWAIEVKRTSAPKLGKGLRNALEDVQPDRAFVVHGGQARFPLEGEIEAISYPEMLGLLGVGGLRETSTKL